MSPDPERRVSKLFEFIVVLQVTSPDPDNLTSSISVKGIVIFIPLLLVGLRLMLFFIFIIKLFP